MHKVPVCTVAVIALLMLTGNDLQSQKPVIRNNAPDRHHRLYPVEKVHYQDGTPEDDSGNFYSIPIKYIII